MDAVQKVRDLMGTALDERGNSVRGVAVCRELSQRFGLHAFEAHFAGTTLTDEFKPARR